MRSSREGRLMSESGGSAGGSGRAAASSKHSNFVARSWARISGRRKKNRAPPAIEEVTEAAVVSSEPAPSTSASGNQQIPWKLAAEDDRRKPFLNRGMDKLRRSIRKSFRRSPALTNEPTSSSAVANGCANGSSCRASWEMDDKAVRTGTCRFDVKYLGSCEVYESRGVTTCEAALDHLKEKKQANKATLYISGDGIRVVDREGNRGLLVDQTIEKVSFCAPHRHLEKGFAYICREATTRRWICHGFLATKESGERISHAVGCAFTICLEQKNKRELELAGHSTASTSSALAAAAASKNSSDWNAVWNAVDPASASPSASTTEPFAKTNAAYQSFRRQLTISERKQDPQTAIVPVNPPKTNSAARTAAKPRPAANPSLFDRQGSFRAPTIPQQQFQRRFNSLRTDIASRSYDSSHVLHNEPIYEAEEQWPGTTTAANTAPTTDIHSSFAGFLPMSTSLQFNRFGESNKENGICSPTLSNTSNSTCQSTPAKSVNPMMPHYATLPSKADEWLEQTLKASLSFHNDTSHHTKSDLSPANTYVSQSGPPPSQPPPPLPVSKPVCDPASGVTVNGDIADVAVKSHTRKTSSNHIEYQLLEEVDPPVSPPRATPVTSSIDVFGAPVFSPTPTSASMQPVTRTGPSLSDPFDVEWSSAVLKKSSFNGFAVQPTPNPFVSSS